MTQTCFWGLDETRRVELLLVRWDEKNREKNDTDLLLRVRGDKKKTEKNDADMLLSK